MKKQSPINNQSTINNHQSTIKRVLIVEDSLTVRQYLAHVINSDPQLEVVGMARDGEEGVKLALRKRPDIITMDIHMPKMNGYEATRTIMAECPVPIVVVTSSWNPELVRNSFRAIEAGALMALEKPPGPGHPKSEKLAAKLVRTLKAMSEVRVVTRLSHLEKRESGSEVLPAAKTAVLGKTVDVVAIGASTGGPPVLKDILSRLERDFPVPILVVQHMSPGFIEGMVEWLNKECELSIRVASDGEFIEKGVVYFAPDGCHMGLTMAGRIALRDGPAENGVRPSVSYLFRSVAFACGPGTVGVLLTGMGKDGALELARMKEKGAVTVAQDKESCVVYGMPAEAVKLNGTSYVLTPQGITAFLNSITNQQLPINNHQSPINNPKRNR